ncbi:MAG: BTAD domain-containing putative transcriptional regulator [Acidobacteriota bacterium]
MHRTRLLSRLLGSEDRRLVLLRADAGYGKTTLLLQWLEARAKPAIYYGLHAEDADPTVFVARIARQLGETFPDLRPRLDQLMAAGSLCEPAERLGALIDAVPAGRRLLLAFDDFHELGPAGSPVLRAIDVVLTRAARDAPIAIASRGIPALSSVPRLRARRELCEITRDDLRFTQSEVEELLPDVEAPDEVAARCEGWIAGIQLARQMAELEGMSIGAALDRCPVEGAPVFEYFLHEVLARESESARRFLELTSVLSTLTPSSCDAVTRSHGSAAVLADLERHNVFVMRTGVEAYRCHALLRAALVKRLPRREASRANVRAARHFAAIGREDLAIDHRIAAGEGALAARRIVHVAPALLRGARSATVWRWLESLPASLRARSADLRMIEAEVLRELGRLVEAEAACRAVLRIRPQDPRRTARALRILGVIAWTKGAPREALRPLRRALRALPRNGPREDRGAVRSLIGLAAMQVGDLATAEENLRAASIAVAASSDPVEHLTAANNVASLHMRRGEVRQALGALRSVLDRPGATYRFKIGVSYGNVVRAACDAGDLGSAERALEAGARLCEGRDDPWSEAALSLGRASILGMRRAWGDAARELEDARRLYRALGFARMERTAARELATVGRAADFAPRTDARGRRVDGRGAGRGDGVRAGHGLDGGRAPRGRRGTPGRAGHRRDRLGVEPQGRLGSGRCSGCSRQARILRRRDPAGARLARARARRGRRARSRWGLRALRMAAGSGPRADPRHEAPLAVELLGGFRLLCRGRDITRKLSRRQTQSVLAYFLLHPRVDAGWQEIAAWAWPESTAEAAHKLFRNALWEIRKAAPELRALVRHEAGRYGLAPEHGIWVDAIELERPGSEGAVVRAGQLLPGRDAPWITARRETLALSRRHALRRLGASALEGKDFEECLAHAAALLAADELDEDGAHLRIAALVGLGRRADARAELGSLARRLKDELGAVPRRGTRALVTRGEVASPDAR